MVWRWWGRLERMMWRELTQGIAALAVALAVMGVGTLSGGAEEEGSVVPEAPAAGYFDAVFANSPFVRSLGLSDSLTLTGVARMENEVFATVFDAKTMESHLVSKTANQRGWQLVEVGGDESDVKTLVAKIQVDGGEVVSLRYRELPEGAVKGLPAGGSRGVAPSLKPGEVEEARRAATNYKEGFSADGFPRAPPPEVVEKLSKLSTDQREEINRRMIGLRNQGLGLDERRRIYVEMVERTSQGRR